MDRFRYFPQPSKLVTITGGLLLVALVGALDFVTGSQISFSVFYLLPISLVTWFTDRRGGIILAVTGATTWLIADLASQITYSHPLIPYWNAMVRLLVFLAVIYLESALRALNQDLEKRVKDRIALLATEVIERKKVEKRLQQFAKRLEILHEIDRAILAAQSLGAVASETVLHVRNLLPCDRVCLLLFDFEARQMIMFDISGKAKEANVVEKQIPAGVLVDFNALLEPSRQDASQPQNDLLGAPLGSSIRQILQSQAYHSVMIVPILAQTELIGCLSLMAFKPDSFSAEHLEIGHEIVNQLGIAIKQARMVDQLRQDQENLQALSLRLLEVQETERRNIARELHDEVGQLLTGIGLTLEMTTQLVNDTAADRLHQAHALVVDLMERVSQLSLELRPALLDDLGLLPTLLWFLDRYTSQTNVKAILKHSGLDEQRFAQEVETAAYRITQEALTNVARHAHVDEVRVTLWFDQDILGIQVEDEGQGFDPDTVLPADISSGLLGMQERAMLLNGKLTIESARGMGTRLLAEIPVSGQRAEKET